MIRTAILIALTTTALDACSLDDMSPTKAAQPSEGQQHVERLALLEAQMAEIQANKAKPVALVAAPIAKPEPVAPKPVNLADAIAPECFPIFRVRTCL